MKNIYSKNEFLSAYKEDEMINEGLFDFLSKMFNKIKGYINGVQGGKEIDAIYIKYKKIIQDNIKKSTGIDLNLDVDKNLDGKTKGDQQGNKQGEQQVNQDNKQVEQQGNQDNKQNQQSNQQGNQQGGNKQVTNKQVTKQGSESSTFNYTDNEKLNEVETAVPEKTGGDSAQPEQQDDPKEIVKLLKQKENAIMTILKKFQDQAGIEMNKILTKYGGAEKNPKLATIINNQKEQLRLDILTAEVAVIGQSGDKAYAATKNAEITKLAKQISASYDASKTGKQQDIVVNGKKYKVGVPYRFNGKNGMKVIRIIKASKEPGKIVAAYTFGKTKDLEQQFSIDKIDVGFKPEVGKKYTYFSKDRNTEIEVTVAEIGKTGKVLVKSDENDKGFYVMPGSLMNKEKSIVDNLKDAGALTNDKDTTKPGNEKPGNEKQLKNNK